MSHHALSLYIPRVSMMGLYFHVRVSVLFYFSTYILDQEKPVNGFVSFFFSLENLDTVKS